MAVKHLAGVSSFTKPKCVFCTKLYAVLQMGRNSQGLWTVSTSTFVCPLKAPVVCKMCVKSICWPGMEWELPKLCSAEGEVANPEGRTVSGGSA